MITRVVVSTAAWLFVASIAFSQMKHSRTGSQKPTPTPTPTPTAQQKIAPASAQIPAKQSPTPPQRAMQAAAQSKAAPVTCQYPPRQTSAPFQQKALPTPAP